MKVEILQLIEGARVAKGLVVIIDVFRAFSTACYAFDCGVETIFPVGDINMAYALKEKNPEFILVGERDEKRPPGFDFGNSPTHINAAELTGKTMVHTTSSGTQGIANALNADEIITGAFVNLGAIVRYIIKQNPKHVSLVCMGYACEYPTDEDTFCANYIKGELEGETWDFPKMISKLKIGAGARFFDPDKQDWSPSSDFDLCLALNKFDFILKVEHNGKENYLKKIVC